MGVYILVSHCQYLRGHIKEHTRYDQGPEIHGEPKRVSLSFGEVQAGWLPESMGMWFVGVERRHPITIHKVVQDTVNEVIVSTATPDWS